MKRELRKVIGRPEDLFFLSASLFSLLVCAVTFFLRNHLLFQNGRIRYGVGHLPAALFAIAMFLALVGFARPMLSRISGLANRPSPYFLTVLAIVFGLCWLPVWLAGGFVQDDWLLLAAASIRKIIYIHPAYSWYALDSVDGNFRPLGTVLYFGYMLKWFGLEAHAFTFGPLFLTLLGSLVVFAIVRELGYSRVAAAAASLLFMTRGMLYTVVAWSAALGDGIAILFCGLTYLFLLKAIKQHGAAALYCHLFAWLFYCVAILGKQSSFVAPLIVALLLFIRPGEPRHTRLASVLRRAATATLGLCVYAATAAVVFFHAKTLLHAASPYPIRFSLRALQQLFSYATWYFLLIQFPDKFLIANMLVSLLGLAGVAGTILLAWKFPKLLGDCHRDLVFAGLAAVASISLFVPLGTRSAAYYGCMSAMWVSIGLGIVFTQFGSPRNDNPPARLCCFLFCMLLVTGFAEIRLEQTGLFPSGGYIWGTYGMDTERSIQADMYRELAMSQGAEVLLLDNCPRAYLFTSLALLDAPSIQRILMVDSHTNTYTVNDRQGLRPTDGFSSLTDTQSYNWTKPLDAASADSYMAHRQVLLLECHDIRVMLADPVGDTTHKTGGEPQRIEQR
jgi:hypothetical protein